MSSFKDYFSVQSTHYRDFRPTYPESMFHFLAEMSPGHSLAWDCATGNGQAARSLVPFFKRIIATDASAQQIQNALPDEKIDYRVSPAEQIGIDDHSVDLITVAQAFHWFNAEKFFLETERVLKPGGVLAIWSYRLHTITPEIDRIVLKYYDEILGSYWPPERKMVDQDYAEIQFPFKSVPIPEGFSMEAQWDFSHLLGYLRTWSAAKLFVQKNQTEALGLILEELAEAWGDTNQKKRTVIWPLNLIVRRK